MDSVRKVFRRRVMLFWCYGLLAASTGCLAPQERFLCGTAVVGDPDVARRCSEQDNQVCICATHTCARVVSTSVCPSGYQYIPPPLGVGPPDDAGFDRDAGAAPRCVPIEERDSNTVLPVGSAEFCPGQPLPGGGNQ